MALKAGTVHIDVDVDSAALSRVGSEITSSFSKTAAAVGKTLGIAAAVGVAASAKIGYELAKTAVTLAADMEQSQIAFKTLLGSGEEAKDFLADLVDFAAKTPFEIAGLQGMSKLLLGFGFSAEEILPMLTDLGDAASALGMDAAGMEGMAVVFGQIQAKGRLMTEDLMQLAERGIPVYEMLQKSMNKSMEEVQADLSAGKISSEEFFAIWEKHVDKNYGGAMAEQSKTLIGVWSTMKDSINQSLLKIGTALLPGLKSAVSAAGDWLNSKQTQQMFKGAAANIGDWISDTLGVTAFTMTGDEARHAATITQLQGKKAGKAYIEGLKKEHAKSQPTMNEMGKRLGEAMMRGMVSAAAKGSKAVVTEITGTITSSGEWAELGSFVTTEWDDTWGKVVKNTGPALRGIQAGIRSAVAGIGGWLVDAGAALIQGFIDGINSMASAVANAVTEALPGPNVFGSPSGKASGGPVSAGSPYIVGERGPELFVPNRSGQIVPNSQANITPNGGAGSLVGVEVVIRDSNLGAVMVGTIEKEKRFQAGRGRARSQQPQTPTHQGYTR